MISDFRVAKKLILYPELKELIFDVKPKNYIEGEPSPLNAAE
jgi:hypothetical protein